MKTDFKIDLRIVEKTRSCATNFDCLTNEKHVFCKVENCLRNTVHFIECMRNKYCSYKMSFGNSFVCTCPTRKEIYNKYGQ